MGFCLHNLPSNWSTSQSMDCLNLKQRVKFSIDIRKREMDAVSGGVLSCPSSNENASFSGQAFLFLIHLIEFPTFPCGRNQTTVDWYQVYFLKRQDMHPSASYVYNSSPRLGFSEAFLTPFTLGVHIAGWEC